MIRGHFLSRKQCGRAGEGGPQRAGGWREAEEAPSEGRAWSNQGYSSTPSSGTCKKPSSAQHKHLPSFLIPLSHPFNTFKLAVNPVSSTFKQRLEPNRLSPAPHCVLVPTPSISQLHWDSSALLLTRWRVLLVKHKSHEVISAQYSPGASGFPSVQMKPEVPIMTHTPSLPSPHGLPSRALLPPPRRLHSSALAFLLSLEHTKAFALSQGFSIPPTQPGSPLPQQPFQEPIPRVSQGSAISSVKVRCAGLISVCSWLIIASQKETHTRTRTSPGTVLSPLPQH